MRQYGRSLTRWPVLSPLIGVVMAALIWSPVGARSVGLRMLIVGGGPEPDHNQVAIERNVAYVARLLPDVPRITLFADGSTDAKTVLFQEEPKTLPAGERAFALLFGSREEASPTTLQFRAPQLGRLDGPARRDAVLSAFERLRSASGSGVLLYFTGHGSQARDRNLDNNDFDLWNGERFSVRDMAAQIATLPAGVPVTLVMVNCFSGSFGNVIFTGGDPQAPPVERTIAGFFAAPRERMAAGCTPEVNEAEYHDFTSYFFAALSGQDRVGRRVTGADYNRDGRVGMDEAFAYSVANETSIDVPVCTSDVFLRQAVSMSNDEIFGSPYAQVRAWATPAQGAALEEMSRQLKLTSETRLSEGFRMMNEGGSRSAMPGMRETRMRFQQAREAARRPLLERWPELRRRRGPGVREARPQVVAELERMAQAGQLKELTAAEEALDQAEMRMYDAEIEEARVLRFVRLAKSIVLAHRLRENGNTAARSTLDRLLAAEAGPLPSLAAAPISKVLGARDDNARSSRKERELTR